MKTESLYGITFVNETQSDVVQETLRRTELGQRTVLYTPNGAILYEAKHNTGFRDILESADIKVPDGVTVLRVARRFGRPLKEKIPGVEVGRNLMSASSLPVFLLGARPGVAEKAAEKLSSEDPRIHVVGTMDGYFDRRTQNETVREKIRSSGARMLVVCLGSPEQEEWIYENKAFLPDVLLFLALGGSIDVYAGVEKRAPRLFLITHTEWLYRMLRHPSKIRKGFPILKLRWESFRETHHL